MRAMYPSILSKLDQKLFIGATPRRLASPITTRKSRMLLEIQDSLGRYSGSLKASMVQRINASSTMIRKANAFEDIKGKKKLVKTRNGMNGTTKMSAKAALRSQVFVCIHTIYHIR
jgi:hypothetical protein